MLNSLFIRNYRNLKELRIDSVNQINLITGKNNTGKSSLLEAVYIYFAKGNPESLWQIVNSRGESDKAFHIPALSSLFTNRIINDSIRDHQQNPVFRQKVVEIKPHFLPYLPNKTTSVAGN